MSSPSRRRDTDIMKLMMSDYEVQLGENKDDFYVKFRGPKESPYEKGIWKVHVTLPMAYPYKSPSIGFCNKIYHPNVDEASGTVCLDVINQTWSPMFDLMNIFSTFLPQLLLYPNPSDPLNGEAAALLLQNPKGFRERVTAHVEKHASVDMRISDDDDEDEEEDGEREKNGRSKSESSNQSESSSAPSESSGDDKSEKSFREEKGELPSSSSLEFEDLDLGQAEMMEAGALSDMDDDMGDKEQDGDKVEEMGM